MWTTQTGPTCPRCGSLVIPGGCVNRCKEETMKTAREVAGELCCAVDALPPTEDMGHAILDVIAAAIEARDLEWVETCATEADPACECDSFTEFSPHAECKGARDAMRRIRALIPKEDSRG